jgi:hypothetical protein
VTDRDFWAIVGQLRHFLAGGATMDEALTEAMAVALAEREMAAAIRLERISPTWQNSFLDASFCVE